MMGTKTPSDIRYRRLVEGGHEPAGGKAEHLPYTDSLIRRAVSEGLTSDGQPLDWTMPRWALAGEDWEDLLAYLKTLD